MIEQFLRKNPVFTFDSFVNYISKGSEPKSIYTIKASLTHHIKQGHIVRIKQGLFASIPYGVEAAHYPINPYLIASFAAPDAILSYHTALSYYQTAYSISYRFTFLSVHRIRPFHFRNDSFQRVGFPKPLAVKNQTNAYVNTTDIQGKSVKITSIERTLVDILDKPTLGGGWEEIWRSLDMLERIKVENVINYALLLNSTRTIGILGYYLEQKQKILNIEKKHLQILQKHRPIAPSYISKDAKKGN